MKCLRTLKIELPPPEVIQDLRTVCHESLAEPTHRRIAAQRQTANTRSERAQEMIQQRGPQIKFQWRKNAKQFKR